MCQDPVLSNLISQKSVLSLYWYYWKYEIKHLRRRGGL